MVMVMLAVEVAVDPPVVLRRIAVTGVVKLASALTPATVENPVVVNHTAAVEMKVLEPV